MSNLSRFASFAAAGALSFLDQSALAAEPSKGSPVVVAIIVAVSIAVLVAVIGVPLILVIHGTRVKNKWGLSTNAHAPTSCPRCQGAAFVVRVGMWGGWKCAACDAEFDKWGRIEAAFQAPLDEDGFVAARARVAEDAEEARVFFERIRTRKPVMTWAIAALSVATFCLQLLWGDGEPIAVARRMGANDPELVLHGQVWRMFAAMVLHADFAHIALNMLALFGFGVFLERLVGSWRYLLLYVLSGLGGSALSLAHGGRMIGVGASGGIWGLMIAGAVVATWPRGLLPRTLATQLRARAWMPVVINLVYSFKPNVDLLAHLGGGLTGALLVYVLARPEAPLTLPRESTGTRLASVFAGLALIGALAAAILTGRPWQSGDEWTLAPALVGPTGISIDVPTSLPSAKAKDHTWEWGDLNEDGAGLRVTVVDQGLTDEELAELPRMMVEKISSDFAKKMRASKPPAVVKLPSGRDAAFVELIPLDKDDARFLWVWSLVLGRKAVIFMENVRNTASDARRATLRAIPDSLREASETARK